MANKCNILDIIFIDIETVPAAGSLDNVSEDLRHLWSEKIERLNNGKDEEDKVSPEDEFENAGLSAEFGKIVCISVGMLKIKDGQNTLYLKSFYGEDERVLLEGFLAMLAKVSSTHPFIYFCGHNSKTFDFPFICRRLLINGLTIPLCFYVDGRKPWEQNWIDTMEMWRFGDTRYYVSLKLLCGVFGIPTPKDDIDGSEVRRVFYEEKDYKRIAVYCEKDVKATVAVFFKISGLTIDYDVKSVSF